MRRGAAGGARLRPRPLGLALGLLLAASPAAGQRPPRLAACEDSQPGPAAHAAEAACSELLADEGGADPARRSALFASRAFTRILTGALDGARSDLDEAVALDPGNLVARVNRAAIAAGRGDLVAARDDLDAVIKTRPDFPRAHLARARVRRALGESAGARADLDAEIAARPLDFEAFALRGDLRRDEADVAGALEDYAAALERRPAFAQVRTSRAILFFHLGERRRAAEEIERALDEAAPGEASPLVASAGLALVAGDLPRAETELAAALDRAPREPMALHLRAILRARRGDAAGSAADSATAAALRPAIAAEAATVYGLDPP